MPVGRVIQQNLYADFRIFNESNGQLPAERSCQQEQKNDPLLGAQGLGTFPSGGGGEDLVPN